MFFFVDILLEKENIRFHCPLRKNVSVFFVLWLYIYYLLLYTYTDNLLFWFKMAMEENDIFFY